MAALRIFLLAMISVSFSGLHAAALDEGQTLALLVDTIGSSKKPQIQVALLKGMLAGLEGRRNVEAPPAWSAVSKRLATSDNQSVRESARALSQIFGDQEAIDRALSTLMDSSNSAESRRAAMAALITQQYTGLTETLPDLLQDPSLRLQAIRAFGALGPADGPAVLLQHYAHWDNTTRRVVIETLATRKNYAQKLVAAIKNDAIQREEIPSYVARSLRDILGTEFTDVYGEIPELNRDISQTIAKYRNLITEETLAKANAGRGRVVFEKTCGACHLMYGEGGKIGPDLTGSNRANLDYLLLNSVAPSADVPEGYRTLLVQTVDGRLLTGVLAEEDNQRIILKTVDQPRLVIPKSDIEARKVSPKSMMPEGQLDQMKRQDLFDLVKYMQTKTQVEVAK